MHAGFKSLARLSCPLRASTLFARQRSNRSLRRIDSIPPPDSLALTRRSTKDASDAGGFLQTSWFKKSSAVLNGITAVEIQDPKNAATSVPLSPISKIKDLTL